MVRLVPAALAVALSWPASVGAQLTVDLTQALAHAREHAPALVAARARVAEARGHLVGASTLLRDNPVIEGTVGRRMSRDGNSTDADTTVTQVFELGGRRAARIAGAEAGIAREIASSEDEARRVLLDVGSTFWRAVAAQERSRLARANEAFAVDLRRTAERRYHTGDIAELDHNLAAIAAARAHADVGASEATAAALLGDLRAALGLDATESLAVHGELGGHERYDLNTLLARIADRPDVRALDAEIHEADADVRLGAGSAWPDVGIVAGYRRDTGDDIPLAGFTMTLPIFARGQELRAVGAARASRLRLELAARRRTAETEIRTAFEEYERRVVAADELARDAIPPLDENERLARRSYEAREIGLPELLILRRDALSTRTEYLDRLLDVSLASLALAARAGVL